MTTEDVQLPDSGSAAMVHFLPQSPFVQQLGIELIDIGEGTARLRLSYRDELSTVGQMLHGGVIAGCIDLGIMTAAWAGSEVPEKLRGVTVSMSVQFMEPVYAEGVDIVGTRIHAGRSLKTCRVDIVRTESGRLVATGTGTYKVG
ncbi:PaaI family thioesterase [Rhodococcoides fascians A21d2]|uniref:PaaI family thioesterase n=1 Tax=Rhodococcoides fascians TaxID=1828 RepID=UPI00055F4CAB|nr:PaaI family thioesterase [Rhodococcus fascians]QIH99039.1 PaaI family thioesterase [Rhodococcus fascians A21d2]